MWRSSVSGRRGQKHLLFFVSISSLLQISSSIVFVKTKFHHFLFDDAPATFAAPLACSEICGSMYLANPLDACSPLQNVSKGAAVEKGVRFALIERGLCAFEDKIRNAQDAGFGAVVVFDNQFKNSLVSMVGDSQGIHVPAVFVLKSAGEILKKFAQSEEGECRICVASEEMIQTVLIISLISLIVIASILALFLFARNLRSRQVRSHLYPVTMSNQMVKDLPWFKYNPSGPRINHMAESCTICLEDYRDGETLRVLPCQHEFHAACVDSWLTKWGTFCPLCKHDMRAGKLNYRVSEQTPLLPC